MEATFDVPLSSKKAFQFCAKRKSVHICIYCDGVTVCIHDMYARAQIEPFHLCSFTLVNV